MKIKKLAAFFVLAALPISAAFADAGSPPVVIAAPNNNGGITMAGGYKNIVGIVDHTPLPNNGSFTSINVLNANGIGGSVQYGHSGNWEHVGVGITIPIP